MAKRIEKVLTDTLNEKEERAKRRKAIQNKRSSITQDSLAKRSKKDLKDYNARTWEQGVGYVAPNFPLFNQYIENMESGLYIFAGESNSGKTAIMTNLFWDLVLNPDNHLYGVYFSLDDAKIEIYPRVIAMQNAIPIGCVKKPLLYERLAEEGNEEYYAYLERRESGFKSLSRQLNNMIVFDNSDSEIANEVEMYELLKKIQETVKENDPDGNILLAIDAIDDIPLKNEGGDKMTDISKTVKKWCVNLDIPILASKHLKKINANRRPIPDDLRDSNALHYAASIIFLVYNDVSKNKDQAKIYYQNEGNDEDVKYPVLEIDWGKNKKSAYKGYTFCHFIPNFSKVCEVSAEQSKYYETSIYQL